MGTSQPWAETPEMVNQNKPCLLCFFLDIFSQRQKANTPGSILTSAKYPISPSQGLFPLMTRVFLKAKHFVFLRPEGSLMLLR